MSATGCGTIVSQVIGDGYRDPPHKTLPRAYSGAVLDFRTFYHPHYSEPNNLEFFFFIDLPMSLVLDTIILPYTGYRQITDGSFGEECE